MKRIALVLLFASAASAQPDPRSSASAEAEAGQKLYAQNDFAGAAPRFVRAYELDPQPAYLFDAAQAYRFAKDCANAAKYFQQFIDVAQQAQTKNLDKVKRYLAEMEACASEHAAVTPPPVAPSPPPPPSPPPSPSPKPPPPTLALTSGAAAPPAVEDRGARKRQVGVGIAGAGAAAVALGAFAQHWSQTVEHDRNAYAATHCTPAAPCAYATLKQLDDKGHRDAAISAAAYSVGGAAIVTGIALYVLGRHDSGEQHVTVVPTSNGASVSLRF